MYIWTRAKQYSFVRRSKARFLTSDRALNAKCVMRPVVTTAGMTACALRVKMLWKTAFEVSIKRGEYASDFRDTTLIRGTNEAANVVSEQASADATEISIVRASRTETTYDNSHPIVPVCTGTNEDTSHKKKTHDHDDADDRETSP